MCELNFLDGWWPVRVKKLHNDGKWHVRFVQLAPDLSVLRWAHSDGYLLMERVVRIRAADEESFPRTNSGNASDGPTEPAGGQGARIAF